jgi:hypothetical protein
VDATPWLVLTAFSFGVASLAAVIAPGPRELLYFVATLVSVAIGVAVTAPKDARFVIALCLVLAGATLAGSSAGFVWRQKRRHSGSRWRRETRRGGH